MIRLFPFLVVCLLVCSCKSKKADSVYIPQQTSISNDQHEFSDGTWCASVEYYNPNTGNTNVYTLNVEVENGQLMVIHWPNGGWLDDSHFDPEPLDHDGTISFESDKGYEYTVTLTNKGGCNNKN